MCLHVLRLPHSGRARRRRGSQGVLAGIGGGAKSAVAAFASRRRVFLYTNAVAWVVVIVQTNGKIQLSDTCLLSYIYMISDPDDLYSPPAVLNRMLIDAMAMIRAGVVF